MDENTGLFQKPLFKRLAWFAFGLIVYLAIGYGMGYIGPKADQSMAMIADVGVCITGLIFWMVFFAQFVLPVNRLKDRWKVVERLVTYLMGAHGPAIFIENGFMRAKEGERKKNGPGVVWLDSASAAVLRTTGHFTRTIGPGVHFTNHSEYIAATADLHTLSQSIGPIDNDEPFKTPENDANFKAIKERADQTNALTRDGITVSASISINFRIKSIPGEGNTRFGFNAKNTEAAIRDSMIREVDLDHPVWNTLPAKMAADIWREYLGKFRLNELFEKNDNRADTTIQFINDLIFKRMTRSRVALLDEFGQVVLENKIREQEYRDLLKQNNQEAAENLLRKIPCIEFVKLAEMGLEVKSVTIKRLFFNPEIEEQLINQWTTLWLKNAQKEQEQVGRDRNSAVAIGQEQGIQEFARIASEDIAKQTTLSPEHALERLIHATTLSANQRKIGPITRDLNEIYSWLKNQPGMPK